MTRKELVAKAAAVLSEQLEHHDPNIRRMAAESILCHVKAFETLESESPEPINVNRAAMQIGTPGVPPKHSGFAIG